jgi:hypothetical protein
MHLLRSIDQQEEERERARSDANKLGRELRHAIDQLVEIGRTVLVSSSSSAAPAQAIDYIECLIAFESLNYPTKRSAEIPDILMKREVFRTNVVLRARCRRGLSHRE